MKRASYPRPHVDWEVLNRKPTLNRVAIVKIVDTEASDDVDTHLPENSDVNTNDGPRMAVC